MYRTALLILFIVTLLLVPLAQQIRDMRPGAESAQTSIAQLVRLLTLPTLDRIDHYEGQLEERSILRQWILPPTQYLLTWLLAFGNEQAYVGDQGWLFYQSDLKTLYHSSPNLATAETAVEVILDFKHQLSARNIELIVFPTPIKPSILPDKFAPRIGPRILHPHNFQTIIDRLSNEGMFIFDPSDLLFATRSDSLTAPYLKTDTHWTPSAMEMVAGKLADLVYRTGVLTPGPDRIFQRHAMPVSHLGDIGQMLQLPDGQSLFPEETVTVQQIQTINGRLWQSDLSAQLLFLGDSFSNIYSLEEMGWGTAAGLAEQLSFELQHPIDKITRNADGAYATRQALFQDLQKGDDRLAGKKLVIYQFAMRELFLGDWRQFDLTSLDGRITPGSNLSGNEKAINKQVIEITAVVKERSQPPQPGSVPYPECLIAIHLKQMTNRDQSIPAELLPTELLAFTWGMKDNRWTTAANLEVGQSVHLRLQPWSDVEAEYGSYNRRELDSEEAWLLDTYWGEIVR